MNKCVNFVLTRTIFLHNFANVLLLNYLSTKVMFFSKKETKMKVSFFATILLAAAKMYFFYKYSYIIS